MEEYQKEMWVFVGNVESDKGKVLCAFRVIDGKELAPERLCYQLKKHSHVVGGMYEIPVRREDDGEAVSVVIRSGEMAFRGMWPDSDAVMGWRGSQTAFEERRAEQALAKKMKATKTPETLDNWARMWAKANWGERRHIENALVSELQRRGDRLRGR